MSRMEESLMRGQDAYDSSVAIELQHVATELIDGIHQSILGLKLKGFSH